jgi:polysaccharide biosynthesis protein PslH
LTASGIHSRAISVDMDIIYLCHRMPYPPNKGDKIGSYHLLRYFSQRHRVHLGTFIDDPADEAYRDTVSGMCASTWFGKISTTTKLTRSVTGFLRNEPLTAALYQDTNLTRWIEDTVRKHRVKHLLVYSSGAAKSIPNSFLETAGNRLVVDFCDVDAQKWQQYAETHAPPMKWIYAREARALIDYDRRLAMRTQAAVVRTQAEVKAFTELAPEVSVKLRVVNNGLDRDFFATDPKRESPFPPGAMPIVFTGHMGYWPNIDAVQWFAKEVLPLVRQRVPNAHFWIVGTDPSAAVNALAGPSITVTGRVPDVRPYLQYASLVVAPNRLGRGIANKALEAMAMSKPLIVSPQIAMGLEQARPNEDYLLGETAVSMADLSVRVLVQPDIAAVVGRNARLRIEKDFDWDRNLARTEAWLLGTDHA